MIDEFKLRALFAQVSGARLEKQSNSDQFGHVTRRGVIAGTASGLILSNLPPVPTRLRVLSKPGQVTVELADKRWIIRALQFGRGARVSHTEIDGRHFIRLRNAFAPGTRLRLDLMAILSRTPFGWSIRLSMPSFGKSASASLMAWLQGESNLRWRQLGSERAAVLSKTLSAHRSFGLAFSGATEFEIRPDWSIRLRTADQTMNASWSTLSVESKSLDIKIIPAEEDFLIGRHAPSVTGFSTHIQMTPAAVRSGDLGLGSAVEELLGVLTVDAPDEIRASFWPGKGGRACSSVAVIGAGSLSFVREGKRPPALSGVQFDKFIVAESLGNGSELMMLGHVARRAHLVEGDGLVLSLAGRSDAVVRIRASEGRIQNSQFPVDLFAAHLPIADGDAAHLDFPGTRANIRIAEQSGGPPENVQLARALDAHLIAANFTQASAPDVFASPIPPDCTEYVVGTHSSFIAMTKDARLQVLRGRDLVNLTFSFFGDFTIRKRLGNTYWLVPDDPGADPNRVYRFAVDFPPQHMTEKAFERLVTVDGAEGSDPLSLRKEPGRLEQRGDGEVEGNDPFDYRPVATRLANPSRLVFQQNAHDVEAIPLTIDALTDWTNLALVVSERALDKEATLKDQLQVIGAPATGSVSTNDLFAQFAGGFPHQSTPGSYPAFAPREDVTQLEMAYRLILSPSSKGRWLTRYAGRGKSEDSMLWHARLDPNRGADSVRAIWARNMDWNFFAGRAPTDMTDAPPWGPSGTKFPLSLDGRDRREIVILSSGYGLPALRRIKDGKEDPNGNVAPPPYSDSSWAPGAGGPYGILIPRPIAHSDIILTALGGSFDSEGQWEPPGTPGSIYSSLTLERWKHKSFLGRDIRVEVAYKGFLLPVGHRATLLKLTERRVENDPHTNLPVAYLVQRRMIVIGRRDKTFPALRHPQNGRKWPAKNITFLRNSTPDIENPETVGGVAAERNGRVFHKFDQTQTNLLAFWPRTAPRAGSEVIFEWTTEEGGTVRSPLLFVSNEVVHDPGAMQWFLQYYDDANLEPQSHDFGTPLGEGVTGNDWQKNTKNSLWPRCAVHSGSARRYAEAKSDGETSFETYSWLLEALPNPTNDPSANFVMDAIMEGGDQPPFYPAMLRANVVVQSINRLLGRQSEQVVVSFNERYLNNAFDSGHNPSELFLNVESPVLHLDFSSDGTSSGGVAKPNARVMALSRKIGIVGGSPNDSGTGHSSGIVVAGTPRVVVAAAPAGLTGMNAASAGSFDPLEFFGGALSDAKLLGILSLKDIVKVASIAAAPKLRETTLFQQSGSADVFAETAQALKTIGATIESALAEFEATTAQAVQAAFNKALDWRTLYPDLAASIQALADAAAKGVVTAQAVSRGETSQDIFVAAAAIVNAGKGVLAQADSIRRNPTPSLVERLEEDAAKAIAILKTQVRGQLQKVRETLGTEANSALSIAIANFLDALRVSDTTGSLLQAVIGPIDATLFEQVDNRTVLKPITALALEQVLQRSAEGLFYDLFGSQIVAAYQAVQSAIHSSAAEIEDLDATLLKVIERVYAAVLAVEDMVLSSGALAGITGWCSAATAQKSIVVDLASNIADELIGDDNMIAQLVENLFDTLAAITIPPAIPVSIKTELDRARALLATAQQRNGEILSSLKSARSDLRANFTGNVCIRIAELASKTGSIMHLRMRAVGATRDVVDSARQVLAILETLKTHPEMSKTLAAIGKMNFAAVPQAPGMPGDPTYDLQQQINMLLTTSASLLCELTTVSKFVSGAPNVDWIAFKASLAPLEAKVVDLTSEINDIEAAAISIQSDISNLASPPDANKLVLIANRLAVYATQHDKRIAALILRGNLFVTHADEDATALANAIVKPPLAALNMLHQCAHNGLRQLYELVSNPAVELILSQNVIHTVMEDLDAVDADAALLQAIALPFANPSSAAHALSLLLDQTNTTPPKPGWKHRSIAVVKAVQDLAQIADNLLHGRFGAIFDFTKIEKALSDALLSLVPTSVDLDYDWGTTLVPFPPGSSQDDALFAVRPRTNPSLLDDLSIKTHVHLDILNNVRTVSATGTLQPFQVNLFPGLGALGDIAHFKFGAATFTAASGQSPHIDVQFEGVTIGQALQFLEPLQKLMAPPKGNGPFIQLHLAPPSIEAGFRFGFPFFPLGYFQVIDLAIVVSADLPLDNRTAKFLFSLSTADAPFMLAAPPYGGGGFLALTSAAGEIVQLEAQFEFGAVTRTKFGPLDAYGRVTAGFYFRMAKDQETLISGFVHAFGQGSIACFSITVSLAVTVTQQGGAMSGAADFEFTFSVGICDISYGFTASYTYSSGGGQHQRLDLLHRGAGPIEGSAASLPPSPYRVRTTVPPKHTRWARYKSQFIL